MSIFDNIDDILLTPDEEKKYWEENERKKPLKAVGSIYRHTIKVIVTPLGETDNINNSALDNLINEIKGVMYQWSNNDDSISNLSEVSITTSSKSNATTLGLKINLKKDTTNDEISSFFKYLVSGIARQVTINHIRNQFNCGLNVLLNGVKILRHKYLICSSDGVQTLCNINSEKCIPCNGEGFEAILDSVSIDSLVNILRDDICYPHFINYGQLPEDVDEDDIDAKIENIGSWILVSKNKGVIDILRGEGYDISLADSFYYPIVVEDLFKNKYVVKYTFYSIYETFQQDFNGEHRKYIVTSKAEARLLFYEIERIERCAD